MLRKALVLGLIGIAGVIGLAQAATDGSVAWPVEQANPQGLIPCRLICTACCGQDCTSRWWCVAYCLTCVPFCMPVPDAWVAGDLYECYDPATGRSWYACYDIRFQGCLCAYCVKKVGDDVACEPYPLPF